MTILVEDKRKYHIIEINLHNPVTEGFFLTISFGIGDLMDILEMISVKWYGEFGVDYSFAVVEGEL